MSCRTEVVAVVIVVTVCTMQMPGVSTTIGGIEHWTSEIEVVAMWIAGIDAEMPVTVAPV
jgi:hypothetical protein